MKHYFLLLITLLVYSSFAEPPSTQPLGPEMKQKSEDPAQVTFENLLRFKRVIVLKNEPDGLRIRHEHGVCKVSYEDLPEDVRQKYGMSLEGARVYRERVKEIAAKRAQFTLVEEAIKNSKLWATGEVFQVVSGGILLRYADAETTKKVKKEVPYKVEIDGPTGLHPDRPRRCRTEHRTEWIPERIYLGDLVYVRCENHSLSAGMVFKAEIYPNENYSYETMLGNRRVVAAYETDLASLLEETILAKLNTPESKPEEDLRLTVVKAHYGTSKVWVDVTERANQLISNNRLEIHSACPASKTPTWISPTDPVPYKKKHTTITYRLGDGEEKTIWVPEGEKIILPP